ncbi:MAG: hypothetical protein KGN36_03225, partial [Acidobacteriota bacterium]|nr:hypothetical protein [Acidobacteriota bacterium]
MSAQGVTSLAFQGFEQNTGDWTPVTVRVPSGGGVLGLPSASGNYHAELTNVPDTYQAGYGGAQYSYFGFASTPPYPGDFSQSISVYIQANWPTAIYGGAGFWIDMSPGHPPDNYGAEHNFQVTPTGSSVVIYVDGQTTPITTITASGWYTFQMTYQKGSSPMDLVTTHMNVFDPVRKLLGTTTVYSTSPGGPLYSQDLAGPGYVWITVWPNGWVPTLAIDDVRADLLAQMGAPKWKVYDYNPSNRAFQSRVASVAPTGGVSFDFLTAPNSAVFATNHPSYQGTLLGDLTGKSAYAQVGVTVAPGTTFQYYGEPDACGGTKAFVRFYFETSTSGKFAETNYWWSNPVAIDLASLVAGDQTMTVALTADKWSDYYGHFGTQYPAEFAAAVKDVESMGLSFGGGCFFENGVGVSSGGGIFRLVTIAAMPTN